ncbi:hypothetical protein SAMD00019534_015430 [Acytostelium subglobosum LB1]|uniref:hypothetical protein n=1 Tax=Acytostelium subglobosum LB1 TaxID=1410327 RepID=UPI0006448631|nr:hypothetical protein SAMD00019534_015430 [Acytostelium subglobosum LB1]GAM18368.1 hypothetical protein SAMD00019534_015430 [Acytostelium subglobosum LB1]|eukprot:XP_012757588.1 hypothetical protein SAMD00019534_015430 [Acytostelium subglobosum LB1]
MYKSIILIACVLMAVSSAAAIDSSYFFLRSTGIVCKKAPCPSWVVSDVNGVAADITIHSLSFAARVNQTSVFEAGNTNAILFGFVSTRYVSGVAVATFNADQAYRVLPLSASDAAIRAGNYYFLESTGIVCKTAPCPSFRVTAVNDVTTSAITLNGFAESYTSYSHFDDTWFFNKVLTAVAPSKAIVQAELINGTAFIRSAFVNLVDPSVTCPALPLIKCQADNVQVYHRDENRCRISDGCTLAGVCIMSIPVCDEGYTLTAIPSAPNGCNTYFCDATFLKRK